MKKQLLTLIALSSLVCATYPMQNKDHSAPTRTAYERAVFFSKGAVKLGFSAASFYCGFQCLKYEPREVILTHGNGNGISWRTIKTEVPQKVGAAVLLFLGGLHAAYSGIKDLYAVIKK